MKWAIYKTEGMTEIGPEGQDSVALLYPEGQKYTEMIVKAVNEYLERHEGTPPDLPEHLVDFLWT